MPRGIPKNGPASGRGRAKPPGPKTEFRHKAKKATSVALTDEIIGIADRNQARLGCSRSSLVCGVLKKYADTFTFDDAPGTSDDQLSSSEVERLLKAGETR